MWRNNSPRDLFFMSISVQICSCRLCKKNNCNNSIYFFHIVINSRRWSSNKWRPNTEESYPLSLHKKPQLLSHIGHSNGGVERVQWADRENGRDLNYVILSTPVQVSKALLPSPPVSARCGWRPSSPHKGILCRLSPRRPAGNILLKKKLREKKSVMKTQILITLNEQYGLVPA